MLLEEVVRFWGLAPENHDKVATEVFMLQDEGGSTYMHEALVIDQLNSSAENGPAHLYLTEKTRVSLAELKKYKPKFKGMGGDGDPDALRGRGRRDNGAFDIVIKDQKAVLRDFFIYAIWFIAHLVNLFVRRDVQAAFFLSSDLNQTVLGRPFGPLGTKSFSNLASPADFYEWCDGPLQDGLFATRSYSGNTAVVDKAQNFTGPYNKVAGGVVRFRQLRVKPDCSCTLSVLGKGVTSTFPACYGHYKAGCKSEVAYGAHYVAPTVALANNSSNTSANASGAADASSLNSSAAAGTAGGDGAGNRTVYTLQDLWQAA